jgi:hypothetical protein
MLIQDVPGRKISILLGHSIYNSKENGFRDRASLIYSSKIVDEQEILRTVSNTSIYCSSKNLVQFT